MLGNTLKALIFSFAIVAGWVGGFIYCHRGTPVSVVLINDSGQTATVEIGVKGYVSIVVDIPGESRRMVYLNLANDSVYSVKATFASGKTIGQSEVYVEAGYKVENVLKMDKIEIGYPLF